MHNDLNEDQIAMLKSLDKDIIIIPDQDSAGLKLAERAAEQGFTVSMPLWDTSIKDVNDAVCRHGRLATLVSILRSRERSRLKIELRRREIEKRISSN
jgi:DNA primase